MKIPYNDLKIIWSSKVCDFPIEGLCRKDGEIMHFLIDDEYLYELTKLNWKQKTIWMLRKYKEDIKNAARETMSSLR